MNIALVGYGRWGKNLYNALNKIPNIDEIYICDPLIKNTEKSSIKFEEILSNEKINAVVVATPASTHFEITKTLLNSGKNVFCEKPLCFSIQEVKELLDVAFMKEKALLTGHTFLFNDSISYIKEFIRERDLLFKIVSGKYSSFGTNVNDVDVLWDFGPHILSIVNYIFGSSPASSKLIPMSFREDGKLESCFVHLEYDQPKTKVVFELSWLNIDKKREIEFNNYETLLRWNDLEVARPVQIYEKQFNKENVEGVFEHFHNIQNNITIPSIKSKEPLFNEMKYFIECVDMKRHKNLKSGLEFTFEIIKTLEELSKQY